MDPSIALKSEFQGVDLPGITAAAQTARMNDFKMKNAPLAAEVERMKLQDEQGRMSALAGYREAAAEDGPVSPLSTLDAYPEDQTEIYGKLDKAFGGMTLEQKQAAVGRTQAIGRAAQWVGSFPDGSPQQKSAWNTSIKLLKEQGWLSEQDAQMQMQAGPNRALINQAMELDDYVKKATAGTDVQDELARARIKDIEADNERADSESQSKGGTSDKAPRGYRYTENGILAFIPGGPADPATKPKKEIKGDKKYDAAMKFIESVMKSEMIDYGTPQYETLKQKVFAERGISTGAPPEAPAAAADGSQASPFTPATREEAEALPSGAYFLSPNGALVRKK